MTITTQPPHPAAQPIPRTALRLPTGRGSSGRRERPVSIALTYLVLVFISLIFIGPFFWMLSTSLKTAPQTVADPPIFFPAHPQWENYRRVLLDPQFDMGLYFRNTIIYASIVAVGATLSCSLVAYSLAKIPWRGRTVLFAVMLGTMMLPGSVTIIPQFVIFGKLHWIGTYLPLEVPAFFGGAFFIFLLRQFYMTIPDEILDAARIDGCSEFGIWWRIIWPLARPAHTTVALFAFIGAWKDFFGPLVYLNHPRMFTLSQALQNFQSRSGGTSWELLMAASILVLAPIIVIFFLSQRTFIQGIATTGMKG